MRRFSYSPLATAGLVLVIGAPLMAQKGHEGKAPAAMPAHEEHPRPMAHPMPAPEARKAEKEVAKAERVTDRAENRVARAEESGERVAVRNARNQSTQLLHGLTLTSAERRQIRAIDKKYDSQLHALAKTEHRGDKTGATDDAAFNAKVAALAAQERAAIRAALPVGQQAKFDANAAMVTTRKP